MTEKLKIAILGADGRMGQAVISALSEIETLKFVAALTHSKSPHLGKDSVALADAKGGEVLLTDDFKSARDSDVVIDFSAPSASLALAETLKGSSVKAIVSGTTGMTGDQTEEFQKSCADLALLQSGNFSLGVNMLEALVELAADKLREGWDIDVLEMHHRHKVCLLYTSDAADE